jgi:arsenate reductase (glutaredoxin)
MAISFAPGEILAAATDSIKARAFDSARRRSLCFLKTPAEETMERITLYHNPACGNSRGALELLRARDADFDIIEYLKVRPTRQALEKVVDMLEGPVADLVRKDKRFKELGLDAAKYADKKAVVALLLEHPELMQRPIVIRGQRAIIARPPEKLETLL